MFWLLQMQAYASLPLALSMFLAAWNPVPELRLQDFIAAAVFAIAIGGEALADAQLKGFARDPKNKGKVCDTGLWAWSRHPNYFFQWLGWWAYPLFAIAGFGTYPWGWLALLGPAFMYWLLVYVSGIPPLEQHMVESRGDRFRAYQRRVSPFFPLPPKNKEAAS
jgi:steroid 5-alpha reductase family enzyme